MVKSKHVKNYSHGGFVSYSDWVSRNTPANMGDRQEDDWLAGGAARAYNKAKGEYDNTQHSTSNNTSNTNNTQTNTNTTDTGTTTETTPTDLALDGLPYNYPNWQFDPWRSLKDSSGNLYSAEQIKAKNKENAAAAEATTDAGITDTGTTTTTTDTGTAGTGTTTTDNVQTTTTANTTGTQTQSSSNTQGTPIPRSEWMNANRPEGDGAAANWDAGANVVAYNRYLDNFNSTNNTGQIEKESEMSNNDEAPAGGEGSSNTNTNTNTNTTTTTQTAEKFTSSYPELAGQEFATAAERDAAEDMVDKQREQKKRFEDIQKEQQEMSDDARKLQKDTLADPAAQITEQDVDTADSDTAYTRINTGDDEKYFVGDIDEVKATTADESDKVEKIRPKGPRLTKLEYMRKLMADEGLSMAEARGRADGTGPGSWLAYTDEYEKTPDATVAETYEATSVEDKAREEAEKVEGAEGELSDGSTFEGAEGELSEDAKADGVDFDPERIKEYVAGERTVDSKELADAQGLDEEAVKAKIAQAEVPDNIVAATTTVKPEELPTPAQIKESDMAQAANVTDEGGLDVPAVAAKLEKFTVDAETLAQAAQGDVDAQSTVQGQLSSLMKDFDDGTPAWAAGAIRAANQAMLSRGMGGSTMAASAILQAAMESALPIATQDAQTFATMNMQNLNNRQQVALSNAAAQQGLALQNLNNEQQAMLQNSTNSFALQSQNLSNVQQTTLANAQIKAALQGQNLSNQQQANIVEAARYAEVSNLNLNNKQQGILQDNANTMQIEVANLNAKQQAYVVNAQLEAALQGKQIDNKQQVAIQNAARYADANNLTFTAQEQAKINKSELMKTIGLAELSSEQAATLQNAAAVASMDMANLSNEQQAKVANAQAFLSMDMANLSNKQQAIMFKAQAMQQALLSDQAAENASLQFNASSENQTKQFVANLNTQVQQFNIAQQNATNQFNAGEENATAKFNTEIENQRDQFNAKNQLVIAQANAQWRQTVELTNTAAQNAANAADAVAANNMTTATIDQVWQRERDLMDFAFKATENEKQRALDLVLADKKYDAYADARADDEQTYMWATLASTIFKFF